MKLTKEQKKILDTLIDKYERSLTFRGENKVLQHFFAEPHKLFPKYADEREYDYFTFLNQEIGILRDAGYVDLSMDRMKVAKIVLRPEKLGEIYADLGRSPKKDTLSELSLFLSEQKAYLETQPRGEITNALFLYIDQQQKKMTEGKYPEGYEDSLSDYRDLWTALCALPGNTEDVFVRDLSMRLFHDSKRLEQLRGRICSILFQYGNFSERDRVFEECNVIKTPSYVMVKGPVVLTLAGQRLDVGKLTGDIALSAKTLGDVRETEIYGSRIVTVENLTSFHRDDFSKDEVVIYLGGYHNRVKRDFLRRIYEKHPVIEYFHFGDIDAGGFYIYEHLRRKTGIPFRAMKMDISVLEQYAQDTKKLTAGDKARIGKLIEKYESGEFDNPESEDIVSTLHYMLDHEVKLEQEAVGNGTK
ncbi:MAG: DUF2220 domain-containing protein [Lachnospiraceae bacterium]|nr:DUF2220 domain-containing protein [Lachnospiraceae bacterium]